jgi:hypothetical protein
MKIKPNHSNTKWFTSINDIENFLNEQYGKGNYFRHYFTGEYSYGWFNGEIKGIKEYPDELAFYSTVTDSGYAYSADKNV